MACFSKHKNEEAFSLVELMVVVAIVSVLAAVATTRFDRFQAKARQSEAKSSLAQIFALQQSYYADKEIYAALPGYGMNGAVAVCPANDLGFRLTGCASGKMRYYYVTNPIVPLSTGFQIDGRSGTGNLNKVLPGCAAPDVWSINEDKELIHTTNPFDFCS
ncbi:MAG: prepilin-type N-terminal cleavage/methylation domain-containing protein [Bdellovibrionota bacterium]